MNASDQKILNMTEDEYQHFQNSEAMIIQKLEITVQCCQLYNSKAARNIVLLHQEWSSITWKQYTPETHCAIAAAIYTADGRFRLYYDKNITGCAALLEQAIHYRIPK